MGDETWERLMQLKAMYSKNAEKPKDSERSSPAPKELANSEPTHPAGSPGGPSAIAPKRSKIEKADRIREKSKPQTEDEPRKDDLKKEHEGTAQTHNTSDGKPKRKRRKLVDNEKLALLLWRVILDHGGSCHADTLAEYAFRDWSLLAPVVSSSPAPGSSSSNSGASNQGQSSSNSSSSKAEPTNFARPLVPSRASLEDIKKLVHQALDSTHQIPFALLYELSNPLYLYKPLYEPNLPENSFTYHPLGQISLSDVVLSYDTTSSQSGAGSVADGPSASKMDVDASVPSSSDSSVKPEYSDPSADNINKVNVEAALEEEKKARELERAERYARDLRRVQFKPDPLLDGCYCLTGNSYAPPHIEGAPDEQMSSLVSVLLPIMETAVNGLHLDKITQSVISQWTLLEKYDRMEINGDMIKHAVHMTLLTHPKFEREGSMHDEFFRIVSQSRRRRSTMPSSATSGATSSGAVGSISGAGGSTKFAQMQQGHTSGGISERDVDGSSTHSGSGSKSSSGWTSSGETSGGISGSSSAKEKKIGNAGAKRGGHFPSSALSKRGDALASAPPASSRASARLAESAKEAVGAVGGHHSNSGANSATASQLPSPSSRLKRRRGEITGKETSSPQSTHLPIAKGAKGTKTRSSMPGVVLSVSNAASSLHPSIAAECGKFYGSVDILTARLRPGPGYACVGCKTKKSERWFHGPSPDEWHCATCGEAWSIEHSCPICGLVYENDDDDDDDEDEDQEIDGNDSGADDDATDDAQSHHLRHHHRRGKKPQSRTADSASSTSPDSSPRRVGRPSKKKTAPPASNSKRKSTRLSHHHDDSDEEETQTKQFNADDTSGNLEDDNQPAQDSDAIQSSDHVNSDKSASGTIDVDHVSEEGTGKVGNDSLKDASELENGDKVASSSDAMEVDGGENDEDEGASNQGGNDDHSAADADDDEDDDEEDEEQDEDDDSDDSDDDDDDDDEDDDEEGKKRDSTVSGAPVDDEHADPSSSSEAHSNATSKEGGSSSGNGAGAGGRKKRKRRKSTFRKSTYPKASKSKAKRTKSLISDSLSAGMAGKSLSKSGTDESLDLKKESLLNPSGASSGPASLATSQNAASNPGASGSLKRVGKKGGLSGSSSSVSSSPAVFVSGASASGSSSVAHQQGSSVKMGRGGNQKAVSGSKAASGRLGASNGKKSQVKQHSKSGGNSSASSATNQSSWIGCDECNRWVMSACDGIKDLSVYDDDNPNHLDYRCALCRGHLAAMPSIFYTKMTAKFFLGDIKEAKKYICSGQFQKDMNAISASAAAGGLPSAASPSPISEDHHHYGEHGLATTTHGGNANSNNIPSTLSGFEKSHFSGVLSASSSLNSASNTSIGTINSMMGIEALTAGMGGKGGQNMASQPYPASSAHHANTASGSKSTASSSNSATSSSLAASGIATGEKGGKKAKYAGTSPGSPAAGVSTRRGSSIASATNVSAPGHHHNHPHHQAGGHHGENLQGPSSTVAQPVFADPSSLLTHLPANGSQQVPMGLNGSAAHFHATPGVHHTTGGGAVGTLVQTASPQYVHPATPHAQLNYGQHPISTPIFVLNAQLAAALDPNIKFAKMESEMLKIAETILVTQQQQLKASFDLAMARAEAEAESATVASRSEATVSMVTDGVQESAMTHPNGPESSNASSSTSASATQKSDSQLNGSASGTNAAPQTPIQGQEKKNTDSPHIVGSPPSRPLPPLSDKSKHALTQLEQRFREEVLNMTSLMANSMAHMMDQHRLDAERAILTILQDRENLDSQAERLILEQFQQFAALKTQTLLAKTLNLYQQDCPALLHATAPPPHPLTSKNSASLPNGNSTESQASKASSTTQSNELASSLPKANESNTSVIAITKETENDDLHQKSKEVTTAADVVKTGDGVTKPIPALSLDSIMQVDSTASTHTNETTIHQHEQVPLPASSSSMDLD